MALSRVRSSRRRFFRWRTRPAPIGSFSGRKSRRLKREDSCVGSRAFWLLVLPVSSVGLVSILRPLFVSSCTIHKEAALAPVAQIFLVRSLEKNSTAAIDGSSLVSEKSMSDRNCTVCQSAATAASHLRLLMRIQRRLSTASWSGFQLATWSKLNCIDSQSK
jgi:hypothetical protein